MSYNVCRCPLRSVLEQQRGAKWWSFKDEEPERRPLHAPPTTDDSATEGTTSSGKSRAYVQGEDGYIATQTMNTLINQNVLTTKKGYNPPADVQTLVQQAIEHACVDSEHWKTANMSDRRLKFKVLTKLMTKLDRQIPSHMLDSLKTGEDVLTYFETEERVSSTLEDIASMDLPPNISIRTEYNKFDTAKDSFFQGRTAYPGRDTYVTSLKNSRKYKTIRTKVAKPGYLDHYYDY